MKSTLSEFLVVGVLYSSRLRRPLLVRGLLWWAGRNAAGVAIYFKVLQQRLSQ